ncbi:MAG: RNA 2',3'-cyclic phosphodiesterase [Phycisphaerae bacterium]
MAIRTFLAIDINKAVGKSLRAVDDALAGLEAKIKPVAPANRHVTVKFLGDVEDARVNDVCRAAADIAGQVRPFEFQVGPALTVPPAGRKLKMVWAEVSETTGRLRQIGDACEESFEKLGFPRQRRPFRPHITLARVKFCRDPQPVRQAIEQLATTVFGRCLASQLTVYSSLLTRSGPVYQAMARCDLGG